MERRVLNEDELAVELGSLSGWSVDGKELVRHFKFENFSGALAFVNRVGEIAEAADHHPDIKFGWGFAEIRLTTHDRGGITDVDVAVAKKIDAI
ncbi:MAG: 4a-hydroxytetrahydrobiopterin dehydratase [Acidobacteria bacterium]|nr:4a-hydroxytetrahydrobiopterin dehydratase [Acidobacteriota bacterium]